MPFKDQNSAVIRALMGGLFDTSLHLKGLGFLIDGPNWPAKTSLEAQDALKRH